MSKPIEKGIFTDGWGLGARRVGEDAFVALLSSERSGTVPVVVIRKKAIDLTTLSASIHGQLGHWTALLPGTYHLAERLPVVTFGGEGTFHLTPQYLLGVKQKEAQEINLALKRMMSRAIGFARAVMQTANP